MKTSMFFGAGNIIFENAKWLRNNMTDAEKLLWFHLKQKPQGFRFRRQHPLSLFIADFYCHRAKLVIELDGSIHNLDLVLANDEKRQKVIEECGIKVLRFSNIEVFQNLENVLSTIYENLKGPK